MKRQLAIFLSNTLGVNKTTNTLLLKLRDYILLTAFIVLLSIDWDKTLEMWGY